MQDPGTSQPALNQPKLNKHSADTTSLIGSRSRHPAHLSDPMLVYDLRSAGRSDSCYAEVAHLADTWAETIEERAGVLLDAYIWHVREFLSEPQRSRGEYAFEFLTLGMLWKHYGGALTITPHWVVQMGRALVVLRRLPLVKPVVDQLRAALSCAWKLPTVDVPRGDRRDERPAPTLRGITELIRWLHATGEFEQEALRLENWRSYLAQLRPEKAAHWIGIAVEMFSRFEQEDAQQLGIYTANVEDFLAGEFSRRGLREDRLFCGRPPAEYHLNMVAAEIMNRGLREAFERTTQKIVLVPTCMRGERAATCRARIDGVDITCTACDPGCAVNHITRRMRNLGATVYLVPHSSGFSRWLTRWQHNPAVGVIAVACLLNILPGGYEMRARRIASQCLPLDYPGCRKHWSRQGIPTAVNEDRLVQILLSRSG
jgi:hypothetical protein